MLIDQNYNTGIYKITNVITRDFYIGQSIHLPQRKNSHFYELRHNCHPNIHLQRSWNKYGEDSFKFEILLYCEPFELTRYEQALVDKWKPAYNINLECVDSSKGVIRTEETKIKQSIKRKGRKLNTNYKCTDEHRKNLSLSHLGNKNTLGKHWKLSEEAKQKISEGNKGRIVSEETRQKIGDKHRGKFVSEETRLKSSIAHKGQISYWKGKKLSEEHKLKMSIAQIEQYKKKKEGKND